MKTSLIWKVLSLACVLVLWKPFIAIGETLTSTYAVRPPHIDGEIGFREWFVSSESRLDFEEGFIAVQNDAMRLYILIDVLGDGTEDPRSESSDGDYAELVFDVNTDEAITPLTDRIYTLWPGAYDLRMQYFTSISGDRSIILPNLTRSSVAAGFGCFEGDGTEILYVPPLAPTCANHRVWEFAIDLREIGTHAYLHPAPVLDPVRMGVFISSLDPAMSREIPEAVWSDFSDMIEIILGKSSMFPPLEVGTIGFDYETADTNGDGIINDPIEITQAVQTRGNTLPLVRGKDTAARVYVEVNDGEPFTPVYAHLYGFRDGHDLPGSPLCIRATAPPHVELTEPILDAVMEGRDNLNHTANFLLPSSWTQGEVTLEARARLTHSSLDTEVYSTDVTVVFTPRKIPTYWIIPINEGTEGYPVLPDEEEMAACESYLKTVYPVADVNFVRAYLPPFDIHPTEIDGAILRHYILDELINYYNFLWAWYRDEPLFPDQIFGYTSTAGFAQAVGYAGPDETVPCTDPGCGHVAAGNSTIHFRSGYSYSVVAHEFDHNLGSSPGWGDHVPGGSADGIDSEWVELYGCPGDTSEPCGDGYQQSDIREFGFDTRLPWINGYETLDNSYWERKFTVIPPYFPDFMSYIHAWVVRASGGSRAAHPAQWTSAYRWERMFDYFVPPTRPGRRPPPPMGRRPVCYVSGHINQNGIGSLKPVFIMPGRPWEPSASEGDYTIEFRNRRDKKLMVIPFTPSFKDGEGNEYDRSDFHFQVPVKRGTSKILLRKGKEVLDTIQVSKSRPKVRITSPQPGDQWGGHKFIKWDAKDRDGDSLLFAILYSPKKRNSWYPVAWNVQGNEYEVDTSLLAGSESAKIMVVATDGFNTTKAVSEDTFFLEGKPPRAHIIQPKAQTLFPSAGTVSFEAKGTDLEDRILPDSSFMWFYGQQMMGMDRGSKIKARLPDGVHEVTLVVFDSDGNTAQDTVTVAVGQQGINPIN